MENSKKINCLLIILIVLLFQSCNTRSPIKNPAFLEYDSLGNLRVKIYDSWCKKDTVYFSEAYDIQKHKNRSLSKVIDSKTFDLLYNNSDDGKKVHNYFYLQYATNPYFYYYYFKDKKYIYIYVCKYDEHTCCNKFYIAGKVSDYDVLGGAYLKVGNKIYCEGNEVKGADIKTFRTFNVGWQQYPGVFAEQDITLGMNKNYIYDGSNPINNYNEFKKDFNNGFDTHYITKNPDSLQKIYFPNKK